MIRIRPAVQSDIPYISGTWLHHMRSTKPKNVPTALFYDGAKALIPKLIARSEAFVCCSIEDPDILVGCIVGEPGKQERRYTVIHWCYVDPDARRKHIASELVSSLRKSSHESARPVFSGYVESEEWVVILKRNGMLVIPSLSFYIALGDRHESQNGRIQNVHPSGHRG